MSGLKTWTLRQDVDEMAVERALAGDRSVRLNIPERALAISILDARGLSAAKIAAALGITPRTVCRHRSRKAAS